MADTLIITQLYTPEPNVVPSDVARMMAEHGTVTVITTYPNYPLGRFYPEVRAIRPTRSVANGVVVWRLPIYPDHSRSLLRRGLSYLSFLAVALVFAPFVAGRPRLVWVYNTPITNYVAALPFRWIAGARLVITVGDVWPDSLLAAGAVREGFMVRALRRFSHWVNRNADHVICATRAPLQMLRDQGVHPEKLVHVPVWTEGAEPTHEEWPESDAPGDGIHRIVYAGNLGEGQWLDPVIRAAALMQQQGLPVQVDLYGEGTDRMRLEQLARDVGAGNVVFHGQVPPQQARAASAGALAQIVSLKPSPLFRMTVPSKLMFSFAAGAPILYCLEGEAAEIAEGSGGAWPFDPHQPESVVSNVQRLLAMTAEERRTIRHRLASYYGSHYSRDHLLSRYRQILTRQPALAAGETAYQDASPSGSRAADQARFGK